MSTDQLVQTVSGVNISRVNAFSQSVSPPLFELVNVPNCLVLEKVYLNGLHALRRFEIRNVSQSTILVKLRSNLGSQIAFQLKNENLPDINSQKADLLTSSELNSTEEVHSTLFDNSPINIATNTVAAAYAFSDSINGYEFNQLFSYMNHVDEVIISQGSSQKVILAFLPDVDHKNRRTDEDQNANDFDDETYDFEEINGQLFFIAYIIDRQQDAKISNIGDCPATHLTLTNETDQVTSKADYQITINFRSKVCRSVLWTSVGEAEINFDDCVNGGTYFKDFTIWNRSEIQLYWLLNTVDLSNDEYEDALKFTDYDTAELLDDKPIPSYSHKRIRVTFKPREIGEFNYDLQIENANDPSNILQSRIHAVVRSVLREESLVVSSGNILDFGDCCAGVWSKQQLVLKNVSEVPIEIHFSAENAEVSFHLKELYKIDPKDDIKDNSDYVNDMTPMHHRRNMSSIDSDGSVEKLPESHPESSKLAAGRHNVADSDLGLLGSGIPGKGFMIKDTLEKGNLVQEVIFGPGEEKTVQVSYRPEKDSSASDFKAGRLTKRTFRIILQYAPVNSSSISVRSDGYERKIIQCKARSCTSFIEVNPKEVNFGDTDVGTQKSVPITITNLSELTARIKLRYVSKVLNCTRDEIVIPPKLSTEVKLDMYPRKVNIEYRKQITVVNLQNRDNDQIIEVKSTNIDQKRITFHSLFYRISGGNFIDFGLTVINSESIRTFTIHNISKKNLVLEITSLLPEMVMYQKRIDTTNSGNTSLITKNDSSILERYISHSPNGLLNSALSDSSLSSADYLDLANSSTLRSPRRRPLKVSLSKTSMFGKSLTDKRLKVNEEHRKNCGPINSNMSIESIISILEKDNGTSPPLFPNASTEEAYVQRRMTLLRELHNRIRDNEIVTIKRVEIPPNGERQIIIIFTPKGTIERFPKKCDTNRINIRLIDFDRGIQQPQFDVLLRGDQNQIPVRELIVNTTIGGALMDLGQKNIHFGTMYKNERRSKKILIQNRSEVPLLYNIRKSGSFTSDHIVFGTGKMGVVRGHGKKEIEFTFNPSLPGQFHEKLKIENIQDRSNDQLLTVKAIIKKQSNFFIQPSSINFGDCLINETYQVQHFTIYTNKLARTLEIRIDPQDRKFEWCCGELSFVLKEDNDGSLINSGLLTEEVEEQIETLKRDLEIAKSKKREEEVRNIEGKLAKLQGETGKDNDNYNEPIEDTQLGTNKFLKDDKSEVLGYSQTPNEHLNKKALADSFQSTKLSSSNTSNLINGKNLSKHKKTPQTSIIFTIKPHTSKIIEIYFKASTESLQTEERDMTQRPPLETITSRILVHEHKNTDAMKIVVFKATVYYDRSVFPSPPPLPPGPLPPTPEEPETDPLALEPTKLDIGRLEVNQSHNYYFTLSNRSNQLLNYEIIIPENEKTFFQVEKHGTLSPQDICRVYFSVVATIVGRQSHNLTVRNIATKVEYTFTLHGYVHYSQYLRFPNLDDGQPELDLGYCYVDPERKFSKVTPLNVENISDEDIFITVQSNLSQQVSVFLDENGTRGQAFKTLLKKKSMTIVWVALHPNLLSVPTPARNIADRNVISNGECRKLIGGIKFSVQVEESSRSSVSRKTDELVLFEIITQTVKLISLIGRSIFSVSEKLISLGSTTSIGETFCGSFTVRNMSSRLPLEYVVECPDGNIISDHTHGVLDGWECKYSQRDSQEAGSLEDIDISSRESESDDKSIALINFRVNTSKYGLFKAKIVVVNKNNTGQIVEVEVRLFVDNNTLEFLTKEVNISDNKKVPLLSWDNISTAVTKSGSNLSNSDTESIKAVIQKGYQDATDPLYERCIEICNKSLTDTIQIRPTSDLDIKVRWGPFGDTRVIESFNEKLNLISPFHKCGPIVELKPSYKTHLYISCPQPNSLTIEELKLIEGGKKVNIQGLLLLNDIKLGLTIKMLDLNARFCVPKGELSTAMINLGKIRHSNVSTEFQFTLRNLSEIPLHYELQSPDCIEILGINNDGSKMQNKAVIALKRTVEPLVGQIITAVLKPRRIENFSAGERIFSINVLNMYNPYNKMILDVHATLTLFELKFDRLIQSELVLPKALNHPVPQPCDVWFTIHNISDKDIRFEIGMELSPYIVNFIKIDVLSRFSNSPLIGCVSISAHSSIKVKVCAYPIETSRIPRESSYLINPDGVTFGKLWVATKQNNNDDDAVAEIPIRGLITESPSFSVSTKKIRFKTLSYSSDNNSNKADKIKAYVYSESVIITNLLMKIPLTFKIAIEGPMELSAKEIINVFPLNNNGYGTIEPGQTFNLKIELVDPTIAVSEDIKIRIIDLNSLSNCDKIVLVGIESADPVNSSFITLRGCKKIREDIDIGGRYELDLGQQDLGSNTITKRLTLENNTSKRIPYEVKTVSTSDKSWLNISRTEGTLDTRADEHLHYHTIVLSFTRNIRSVYSTYLIIKNLDNPSDTKTIRVMMEVVSNVPLANNHVFDIYVNGVDTSLTSIEMTNLFYGSEYSARSMVIYNRETVPLEFTFQTNLDYDDPTEILFSTSRMSAKLFKTLTVEPENNIRVYIRLRPLPSRGFLDSANQRNTDLVEKKAIEIYVNCRLVKDYQQTILLKAECRMPSLRVNYNEMEVFMGKISRRHTDNKDDDEWNFQFDPEFREIKINNLFDRSLEYEIVNDTMYFKLEFSNNVKKLAPKSFHNILVRPKLESLIKNAENVRREKYIQEIVTVYNKERPSENYFISLRISFGHTSNFQFTSDYKSSYAYGILENYVVRFLSNFNSNAQLFDLTEANEEDKKKITDLEVQYLHIVDQIIYYATTKSGENWFQLASLLFGAVLGNKIFQKYRPSYLKYSGPIKNELRIWPPELSKWVSPLNYFISFFPYRNPMLETLKELHKNLVIL